MSDWKGMDDLVVVLDVKQSVFRVFRATGGVEFNGDSVRVRGKPSDVNLERTFGGSVMRGIRRFFGGTGFKNSDVLDTEVTLVFNRDFFYGVKDGVKPQVFMGFSDTLDGLPNGLRNDKTVSTFFELWYNVTGDALAKIEALKNNQLSGKEFWNVVTGSQSKMYEGVEDIFKTMVVKMAEQQGVRLPSSGSQQTGVPQQSSGGFVPRT